MAGESYELLFKVQAQGQEQLQKIEGTISGLAAKTKIAHTDVGAFGGVLDGLRGKFEGILSPGNGGAGMLTSIGTAAKSAIGSLNPLGVGLGVVTAGFGAFAMAAKSAIEQMGKAAESTLLIAERTGLTTKEVGQFSNAAKLAGVDAGVFEQSMRQLSQVLSDNSEEGRKGKVALSELGVQLYGMNGELRPMGELFLDLGDKIGGIENPVERANAAMKVFGRAGREMIPLLGQMREQVNYFRDQGFGMDEKKARELDRVHDDLQKIEMLWGRLAKKGKVNLVLALQPVVEFGKDIAEFLNAISDPKTAMSRLSAVFQARLRSGFRAGFVQSGGDPYTRIQGAEGAEGLALLKREMDLLNGGDDALKSRLDEKKRELAAETARIEALYRDREKAGGIYKGPAEEEVRKAEALRKEVAGLEAQAKASGERKAAVEQLIAIEKAARVAGLSEMEKINDREADLLKALGKGYEGRVRTAFDAIREAEGDKGSLKITDLWAKAAEANRSRVKPSLYRPGETFSWKAEGETEADRQKRDLEEQGKALLNSLALKGAMEKEQRTRNLAAAERMIELTFSELDAAARIRDLRIATAETVLDLQKANLDYTVREAEIRRSSIEKYKETAGRVFDSLTASGGGGLSQMFTGQLKILERQLFVNLSGGLFQSAGGFLGKIGEASGLGKILKGTIFDPANKSPEINSRDKNTKAIDRLTGAISGAAVPGAGGAIGAVGGLGGVFGAGADIGGMIFRSASGARAAGSVTAIPGMVGVGIDSSGAIVSAIPKGASGLSKGVGIAGALAGAGVGIYAGVDQGGARGALTATGSAAGAAGAIMSIAGFTGPAAPILMGVGLALGMIPSLLGDPKKKREAAIDNMIAGGRFSEPESIERSYDLASGGSFDYDYRGRSRTVSRTTVQITVPAMDSKSFLDRAGDICLAVRKGLQDGSPLSGQILQTVGVNG
jgi:hypothetical protein